MTNYNNYIYKYINTIKGPLIWITFFTLVCVLTSTAQNYPEIQLANEYLIKGEKKKALELYRELSKDDTSNPVIYNNYFNLLLELGSFDEAQSYLKRNLRKDPENYQYRLDVGFVYIKEGDVNKADKYFRELIGQSKTNIQRIKMIAEYFTSRSLSEYGVVALTTSRDALGNPYLFCLDLAMLFRIQGNLDRMVNEYLNYVTQNSANIQYVKNVLQTMLTKPAELESLEKLLYDKNQQFPDVEVYSDLLIWVTIQQKNFYAAFIQARAYDKRYRKEGEKCMEVARVALDNDDYENAARIYRYVIREFSSSQNRFLAGLGLLKTREAQIKTTYPVRPDSIRSLLVDYETFINQFPDNPNAWEATRNEAMLYATYLDEKDTAIRLLNQIIGNSKASWFLKAKAKLDLGDIYLLKGEPWESTLLYSQVEKTLKDSPIGYEAKLRNAKLSYYRGDFRLAQEHLDILKEATTREIANDALELSLRIKENIAFDTLGEGLRDYARIELLLFQNKIADALEALNHLKEGKVLAKTSTGADSVYSINNLPILDDALWLEARIFLQKGEFERSISLLEQLQREFPQEVLADDAMFQEAEIYERQLGNKTKAMELYREFLNKYPGSVFAAEARKRYRTLRGDFNSQPAN
jgi:tetratricopeptide (TPR) repeat protein